VVGYTRLETGFLPDVDEGGFVIDYWTPAGTSLPETDRMLKRIEAILKDTKEVGAFTRRTGTELGLFATDQNTGDFVVKLKDRSERDLTAGETVEVLRGRFEREIPGVTIEFVMLIQDMLGDLEGNPEPIELKIFGDDLPTLARLGEKTAERMKKIDGLVDVVVPQRGNPELDLHVDPTRAAKVGFTVEQVSSQIAAGLLGRVATAFRQGDRLIDVRVRYPDRDRFNPAWVLEFPLVTPGGFVVPLSATADVDSVRGESELHREDLKQMVPITARLEGIDMRTGVREIRKMMDAAPLPLGYSYQIGGLYETQQQSFRSMMLVLSIAVLLVFGVMVAQFREFTAALVIMSAAPLSFVGAFGLLVLTDTPLNVSSFMGLILLIGLIVKNGIILIDYADIVATRVSDPVEVLVEAGAVRLRPILMTTLCTLFGLLPLALGLGAGAEMQKPLAIAVIGGLSVSTIVTLIFVPTVTLLVRKQQRAA
jgi:multidrug efflux pump subunit AcrB